MTRFTVRPCAIPRLGSSVLCVVAMLLTAAPSQADTAPESAAAFSCPPTKKSKESAGLASTLKKVDEYFGQIAVVPFARVLFFDVLGFTKGGYTQQVSEVSELAEVHTISGAAPATKVYERAITLAGWNDEPWSQLKPGRDKVELTFDDGDGLKFDVKDWDAKHNTLTLKTDDCSKLAAVAPGTTASVSGIKVPFIVLWLVLGALFFTFRYAFINIRGFVHAVQVTAGKFDKPDDPGEVTHFQALSSALSATVGLGNIASVAIAISVGGPGAVFWMVTAGFLGMSSKFSECTLGQLYRVTDDRGQVSGGPMRYLRTGLAEVGFPRLGRVLSVLFALLCVGASFGGGNMFQANQSYAQVKETFGQSIPFLASDGGALVYGLAVAFLVAIVIIGGIKRIGAVASFIVPIMCTIYLLAGFFVLFANASEIGPAFATIVREAFSPIAVVGGGLGVLMRGFQRAAFSNEAGVGSAAIAHSAAATDEPVREGVVALLEPFIDTIIVCTMTGLVVVITQSYMQPGAGIEITSRAFASAIPWFPSVLTVAVFMFAFSTMISWSYYGERCFTMLFGPRSSMSYKVIFVLFVVLGSVLKLGSVLDFSDLMVLGMAFPNILGMYFLSGKVKRALDDYLKRMKEQQATGSATG